MKKVKTVKTTFFSNKFSIYYSRKACLITKQSFFVNKKLNIQFVDDVNKTGEIMSHPKKIKYFLSRINPEDENSLRYSVWNNTSFLKYGVYYNNIESKSLNIVEQQKIKRIYEYLYLNGYETQNVKLAIEYINKNKLDDNSKNDNHVK